MLLRAELSSCRVASVTLKQLWSVNDSKAGHKAMNCKLAPIFGEAVRSRAVRCNNAGASIAAVLPLLLLLLQLLSRQALLPNTLHHSGRLAVFNMVGLSPLLLLLLLQRQLLWTLFSLGKERSACS